MSADVITLAEERDFLLRSLRDLEAERAAGDISDHDYHALKEDYTARAAAAIRALRQAEERGSAPGDADVVEADGEWELAPPRLGWKKPVSVLVVVALAVLSGWAVASSAGDRTPGQSVTGSVPQSTSPVQAKLAAAQDLIGQKKVVDAIKAYDEVLTIDPNQPEALAYRGWLLYLAGLGDQGLDSVTKATQADASYPDAHFFRGQMLCELRHDDAGAAAEFQQYLGRFDPNQQGMAAMVEARLKSAQNGECSKAGQAPPVTAPPPTTPASPAPTTAP